MGALAALDCLKNTGVDPKEIDVILCVTEEWKEYPLTTSALYVQDRIGAVNAWGNRRTKQMLYNRLST